MDKYIDAEKLKKEIEKRIKSTESCPLIEAEFGAEMRREGKTQTYNEILSLVTSLQQEQPASELLKQVRGSLRDSILAIIAKRGILQPDGSMRLPVYRPDGDNVGVMGRHLFADVDTALESDGALIVETVAGGFGWDELYTDDLEALLEHLSGMNDEDYQEAREYAGEDE